MGVIYRIKFHLKMRLHSIKNWWEETVLHKTDEERIAKFNALADSISQEEKDQIAQSITEQFEKIDAGRPKLNPRRTMLIGSRPEERNCNSATASYYRQAIMNAVEWALERGITAFLADYYTPLGLLALETLAELRDNGADIRVYAVKSCLYGQRRTYRVVPETSFEMVLLADSADYCFREHLFDIANDAFPGAWVQYSESGLWTAKDKVPPYLLEAWGL